MMQVNPQFPHIHRHAVLVTLLHVRAPPALLLLRHRCLLQFFELPRAAVATVHLQQARGGFLHPAGRRRHAPELASAPSCGAGGSLRLRRRLDPLVNVAGDDLPRAAADDALCHKGLHHARDLVLQHLDHHRRALALDVVLAQPQHSDGLFGARRVVLHLTLEHGLFHRVRPLARSEHVEHLDRCAVVRLDEAQQDGQLRARVRQVGACHVPHI
mmetsp:Transcript_17181/g.42283  ORF Transcript_17181/g.42283 Transcript_17181/m.42283 type:complete len:214 (+) Transcript_17181:160-801(+)